MSGYITPIEMQHQTFEILYSDFSVAGLTNDALVISLPAKTFIKNASLKVITAGVGTTTLTLSLGDAGDNQRYLTASDAKAAPSTVYSGVDFGNGLFLASATDVRVYAIATVDNLDQLTAGRWIAYLQWCVTEF